MKNYIFILKQNGITYSIIGNEEIKKTIIRSTKSLLNKHAENPIKIIKYYKVNNIELYI